MSAVSTSAPQSAIIVTDYGAVGDGHTDNTAAFQRALDAVAAAGGGIVDVPVGRFYFKGHLTVRANTTLRGIFNGPPGFLINKGSVLLATEGRGNENSTPFISVKGGNSTITGLSIFYPEQGVNKPSSASAQVQFKPGSLLLKGGESKTTSFGKLSMQTDGNFVLDDDKGKALWASDTAREISSDYKASFQGDGNLVLYHGSEAYWSSATNGHENSTVELSSSAPFLSIVDHSSNLVIWPNSDRPQPYPWTIADESGPAGNVSIINVGLLNSYLGMKLGGRHFVSGVYGQPLYLGISVDNCMDIGRIENVHFWPFTSDSPAIRKWQRENAVAFEFGRSDWQYMTNCFCIGYKIGYHFVHGQQGPCNGSFMSIGSDSSGDSVVVEQSWPYGIQILNGEFVADSLPNSTGVRILASNTGVVSLHNCSFWGPSDSNIYLGGTGQLVVNGCIFREWDQKRHSGAPSITLDGGSAIITGNLFNCGGPAHIVRITDKCKSAVVTSNMATRSPFTIDAPKSPPSEHFCFSQNVSGP